MLRSDGLKICDNHLRGTPQKPEGDVVTDGMTILPGMIEVKDGKVWEYTSTDPLNRIVNENGNPCLNERILGSYLSKQDLHFCRLQCFEEYKDSVDK